MTEIKKIKTTIDCAKTDFRAQLAFGGEIVLTKEEISSLLTTIESLQKDNTYLERRMKENHSIAMGHAVKLDEQTDLIESQKEEIESWQKEVEYRNLEIKRQIKNVLEKRRAEVKLERQLKEQKAITEIAVKGLQFYANEKSWEFDETGSNIPMLGYEYEIAKATIAKIERLQNDRN